MKPSLHLFGVPVIEKLVTRCRLCDDAEYTSYTIIGLGIATLRITHHQLAHHREATRDGDASDNIEFETPWAEGGRGEV